MSAPEASLPSKTEKENLSYLQKVWRYRRNLNVEPFYFFYIMASISNNIAMVHFPTDKSCRLSLGYSKEVCSAVLDKSEYDIDCKDFNFENTTEYAATMAEMFFVSTSVGFNYTVCKAESGAQKLIADVVGKRAAIANIFPLIVLLFAGSWSDRYNKRKACIIMPIVGECLSFVCLLISAIFFEQIPMEFGAYTEAIVPALFGGNTLCFMAIDSYMTITTPEKDRIFRFGIYAMFSTVVTFAGTPISGFLFQLLGYIMSFAMAASLNLIGILYVIFVLKEPKSNAAVPPPLPNQPPPCLQTQGADNPAYEITNAEQMSQAHKNVSFELSANGTDVQVSVAPPPALPKNKSCLRQFFDPNLVMDYLKFPLKKRSNRGRMLLAFIILAYVLVVIQVVGETEYVSRFAFKKLNWNGNDFSIYFTIGSLLAMAGTFIATTVFSKLLKLSDPLVGFIAASTTILTKILMAFSTDTATFYVAALADSFSSMRVIAIKSIGSSIVAEEELGKMYSILSISVPIFSIIFTPIYSNIYLATIDTFTGAIFLFSELFAIPNAIVFIICYFVMKTRLRRIEKREKVDENQNKTTTQPSNTDVEITSL